MAYFLIRCGFSHVLLHHETKCFDEKIKIISVRITWLALYTSETFSACISQIPLAMMKIRVYLRITRCKLWEHWWSLLFHFIIIMILNVCEYSDNNCITQTTHLRKGLTSLTSPNKIKYDLSYEWPPWQLSINIKLFLTADSC